MISKQFYEIVDNFDMETGRNLGDIQSRPSNFTEFMEKMRKINEFRQRKMFKKNTMDFLKYNSEFIKY